MGKFEQMADENDVFRIMRDGSGYVGIVYHPDTGKQVEKFHAGSEQAVRLQLIKYIYSTIPISYNRD
jgi:hypothetical protein